METIGSTAKDLSSTTFPSATVLGSRKMSPYIYQRSFGICDVLSIGLRLETHSKRVTQRLIQVCLI